MSNGLIILLAAILPAILWVVWIWWKDKYQHEPVSWILRGVAYGVLSAMLAGLVNGVISATGLVPEEPQGLLPALWKAFVGAAIPEESIKLLMLWLLLRKNPYFDERFDGIVYACCIGMGFAGMENIIYLFSNLDRWETVAITRAIFSVPGHFMFAVGMGYFYSMLYFGDMSWHDRSRVIWVPVTLHGIYDGLLFMASLGTLQTILLIPVFYVFCFLMYRGGMRRIKEHLERDENDPNQVAYHSSENQQVTVATDVTYTFRVAEQLFTISGKESWLMAASNYAPFRVPDEAYADADKCFAIAMQSVERFDEVVGFEHFFTDNSDSDMPRIEVWQSHDQWLFRVSQVADAPVCCEIIMTKDFKQATLSVLASASLFTMRFAIDNAAMLLFAFATSHRHILEMHASVVVHEGKARLFLGHSGTGKSTHARQWLAQYHTAHLLNDDNPILLVDEQGQLWVYGSPWSGKTPCYRNEHVPVAAIIQLEQAPQNIITDLTASQAYAYILSSCSGLKVLHEAMDGIHDTISSIVLHVPVKKLQCLPDKQSAQLCYETTR